MLFRKKKQASPANLVNEEFDTVAWLVQNMTRRQYNRFKSAMDKIYEGCIEMRKLNDSEVDEIESIEKSLEKEVENGRH